MPDLPIRLRTQPLVESLLEIRVGAAKQPMPVLLPGLIFSKLPDLFTGTEALPLASFPKEIRQRDPNLKYQAYHRVFGERYVASIGDNVVALSTLAPYGGWADFRQTIERVFAVLQESRLIDGVIRYSMKSLNIIPPHTERQLDMIALHATRADDPIPDQGFRLRCEFNDEHWVRIVDVTPNAVSVSRRGEKYTGLSLNVDCIKDLQTAPTNLNVVMEGIDELHHQCKALFFSLLTPATIEALGPIYND